MPIGIESEPAPEDNPLIRSVHVSSLAWEVLKPLHAIQKGIADAQAWVESVLPWPG